MEKYFLVIISVDLFSIYFNEGPAADYYPYPFIDVLKLGYAKAVQNSGYVTIAFIAMSLLVIGYGKISGKAHRAQSSPFK
jgi:hypothetical protein